MPIKQWLHFDCLNVYEPSTPSEIPFDKIEAIHLDGDNTQNDARYTMLRQCFADNETSLKRLHNSKVFMVGCGAIGCEMLKNYALLGIGCQNDGIITITDNDLIEKSNLNRQFLFRQEDIQKSKSITGGKASQRINPQLKLKVLEEKVCPASETTIFNDQFFTFHDVCVNALDNVEARRYMDNRCVANQRSLLETGTLGPKGHVQVILPHLTESYTSQRDPQDNDIPYCTLKSFPSNIEHCIEWARDKFESSFTIKPNMFSKFFTDHNHIPTLIETMKNNENLVIDGSVRVGKMVENVYCWNWEDCLRIGRVKFEKYFSNKAKNLLHCYPEDSLMQDGSPFWKPPKRRPTPLKFDPNNQVHLSFVKSCARLFADVFKVEIPKESNNDDIIINYLKRIENEAVPEWKPSNKRIIVDETKKKEEIQKEEEESNSKEMDNQRFIQVLQNFSIKINNNQNVKIETLHFEKDFDANGHIDYIWAAANLRATMYSIETSQRLLVKRIAGKIVPAIATTTSVIAGLATIELVKILKGKKDDHFEWKLDDFRNYFINLSIPLFLACEPCGCVKEKLTEQCFVTLWDKWNIKGTRTTTLKNFIDQVKNKYKLTVSGLDFLF
jgi:ubiquitin-activating enzyme E1-like protein 2